MYRNDGGAFTNINAGLTGVIAGMAKWGDVDNDLDPDILVCGRAKSLATICEVYRNDDGNFVNINAGLIGLRLGTADWIDYDNDGDLDLFLTGRTASNGRKSIMYNNNDGTLTDSGLDFVDVDLSATLWRRSGDRGFPVLDLMGQDGTGLVSIRYETITFPELDLLVEEASLVPAREFGAIAHMPIGVLVTGRDEGATPISEILDDAATSALIANVGKSAIAVGDYDNDSHRDFLVMGEDENSQPTTVLYRVVMDARPQLADRTLLPFHASRDDGDVVFSFGPNGVIDSRDYDGFSNQNGFPINLQIGTAEGTSDAVC